MTNQNDANTPLGCGHLVNMQIKAISKPDGPEYFILFDLALNISKYDLAWTDGRQELFQKHLQEK